jgi:hypothetical protein
MSVLLNLHVFLGSFLPQDIRITESFTIIHFQAPKVYSQKYMIAKMKIKTKILKD